MTAKSSGPSLLGASVVAPRALTEAIAMEEAQVGDAGTTETPARTDAISLMRNAGRANFTRAPRD